MMRFIPDLLSGLLLLPRALLLILRKPSLLALCIAPLMLSLAVYYWIFREAFTPLQHCILEWTNSIVVFLLPHSWEHYGTDLFGTLVGVLVGITFLIASAFSMGWLSNILALPFNDFLAERSERFTSPPLPNAAGSGLKHFFKTLIIDLRKSLFVGLIILACIIFSLIPLLNVLAVILLWLMISFQYLSYPQTRRGVTARQGFKQMLQRPGLALGFGVATMLGLTIPVLSLLVPPVAVVGGTLLYRAIND